MKKRTEKITETPFTNLSWNDLEQWVGATILERGKSYRHRVQDLAMTADGQLIATVAGTEQYITQVWLEDGELGCECSCPYWDNCKHAVAVILACFDSIKSKTGVPLINAHDLEARLSVYGMADEHNDEPDVDPEQARITLNKLTKAQLIDWAIELFSDTPSLFDTLPTAQQPVDVPAEKTIAKLRQQIRKTTSERGWQDCWSNNGYIPDYSGIQKQLTKLLRSGHIEAVLELGEELFTLGSNQVGESDDDGATAEELASCLAVVFEAMAKSQKPAAERMIWYWDKLLQDEFVLLENTKPPVSNSAMAMADWREVAEEFTSRLASCPKPEKENGWSSKYHRQQLLQYTLEALGQAGKNKRAIQLMTEELPHSDNYIELVDYLIKTKAHEQAEHFAYKGFDKTIESSPGIAWSLVERLQDMVKKRKNWPLVAALQVVVFLDKPCVDNYRLAQKASSKAGCWPQVQDGLLAFLETGVSPSSADDWPLPDAALTIPASKRQRKSPDHHTLINLALYEKRTEDALRWFQQTPHKSFHAEEIAQAVKKTHPDISLEIWQDNVEVHIAKVKPSAYREAMPYLKKMKALMQSLKRSDDYRDYVARLRQQHKAKRRLIEELNALDSKGKKNRPILSD